MGTKKPTHSNRFQTPSVSELTDRMVMVRLRLNNQQLKHFGRKLKDGPLLNAVVAWFLEQEPARQDEIAREGLAIYERIRGGAGAAEAVIPIGEGVGMSGPPAGPAEDLEPATGDPLHRGRAKGKKA